MHPTRSCGENDCIYHKILRSESRKLKNTYNLSGEYGIGYTSKGEEFWFDLEDYDKVNNYCWYKDEMGYVRTNTYNYENNSRSYLFLHNLIMNIKPNMDVIPDHIGGIDTIHDNRKLNLRLSDRSKNNMNTLIRKDNTSVVKGVNWSNRPKGWRARIQVNKKRIDLGVYDSLEEATRVRKEAEEKYFGEHSYDKSRELYKRSI